MNRLKVPGGLNLAVTGLALLVSLFALWLGSRSIHALNEHSWGWMGLLVAAVVFAFSNNTLFSLLHESVHGVFHDDKKINYMAGVLCAAMFPTGYAIQRVSHIGHHKRNRTDLELYDYYLPGQSKWLKTYWLYCLLTGFYWAIIPVGCLIFLVFPWAFASRAFQRGPARWWGFELFVRDIAEQGKLRVWSELLFVASFQTALWFLLELNWAGWLICYWSFGLVWSATQYVIHAWTVRSVRDGAWNLSVNPIVRAIFLNYHLHLAHHRNPNVPWLYAPQYVGLNETRPTFWSIYFSLWGGARPAPPGAGPEPLELSAETLDVSGIGGE